MIAKLPETRCSVEEIIRKVNEIVDVLNHEEELNRNLDAILSPERKRFLDDALLWGRAGCKISPNGEFKALNQDEIDEVLLKTQKDQTCIQFLPHPVFPDKFDQGSSEKPNNPSDELGRDTWDVYDSVCLNRIKDAIKAYNLLTENHKLELFRWLDRHGYANPVSEQKPELVQQPPITYTYNSNASRDERLKAALLALLNSDLLKVKEGGYFTKQDLIEWVERIPTDRPAEWTEEDKDNLDNIIWLCENCENGIENVWIPSQATQIKNLIKSLRPPFKPSEEQMKALKYAIKQWEDGKGVVCPSSFKYHAITELYEQLKKLM